MDPESLESVAVEAPILELTDDCLEAVLVDAPVHDLMDDLLEAVVQQGRFIIDLLPFVDENDDSQVNLNLTNDSFGFYQNGIFNANVRGTNSSKNVKGKNPPRPISPKVQKDGGTPRTHGIGSDGGTKDGGQGTRITGQNFGASENPTLPPPRLPSTTQGPHEPRRINRFIGGNLGQGAGAPHEFTALERGSVDGSSSFGDEEPNPFVQDHKPRCCPLCTIL